MGKKPLILKHVKLTPATHKALRKLQVEWEVKTIDQAIQRLIKHQEAI